MWSLKTWFPSFYLKTKSRNLWPMGSMFSLYSLIIDVYGLGEPEAGGRGVVCCFLYFILFYFLNL